MNGTGRGARRARVVWVALPLLGLAAAGYALFGRQPGDAAEPGSATATKRPDAAGAAPVPPSADAWSAPPAAPVPVETALARRGDLVMRITAAGVAEATRQIVVQAGVSGVVREVPVREGQRVAAGDLLVAFDDAELQLKLQMRREALVRSMARFAEKQIFLRESGGDSEAVRELAEAQNSLIGGVISREQFRSLIDDPRFDELFSTITREEVTAAQDGLLTDRANYAMAQLELERARVKAPFGGQIAQLRAVPGQRLGVGAELLTLVDADPIRVRVRVLESDSAAVRVGRAARVRFAALPGEEFSGAVEAISPLVDTETKTLEAVVSLPNPELRLRPGMSAQVSLDTEIVRDRVLVPAAAVLLRQERPLVFVVRGDRAQWVYIQRGRDNGEWVEVLDGVQPGDEVIVSGHFSLAHDALVRVVRRVGEGAGGA